MATDEEWFAQTEKDRWQTPPWLYEGINERLEGPISLDPCAGIDTQIGFANWSIQRGQDGLDREWYGTVFVNPPFSEKQQWVQKVIDEIPNTECIFLVTPDSTDVQSWWHDGIVEHAEYVWFSDGRIDYIDPETGEVPDNRPTFGTALSIFGDVDRVSDGRLLGWLADRGWLVPNELITTDDN